MTRENDIRKEILLQTYAARPLSITAERIQRDARKQRYDFTTAEIARELVYLQDQGLIVAEGNPIGSEKLYRIHALGVTYYEQNLA